MNRREVLGYGAASLSAMALSPLSALAQAKYPDHPIRLIVPFSAGGVVDLIGRLWADKVKPTLGSVVIENRSGAGGMTGTAEVARASHDGYTLLLGNTSTMIIVPAARASTPYDPIKDFMPISIVAISANAIMVNAKVPVKTLKELVAYIKANPGKMSYGSPGAGTLTNLTGEMFKMAIHAPDVVHVPYRGAGPGIADLVSGHIPMMMANVTAQLLDLHRQGQIRILAVASPRRLKGAPDIPTTTESGLPTVVAQLFSGLFAPAGTPKAVINRVAQATQQALAQPEFQQALIKAGLEPGSETDPETTAKFVHSEHDRLTPIVKAVGFKM
jgi:tripartite-type tricarboxylate transporter receptor subunit TctC